MHQAGAEHIHGIERGTGWTVPHIPGAEDQHAAAQHTNPVTLHPDVLRDWLVVARQMLVHFIQLVLVLAVLDGGERYGFHATNFS